MVSLVEFLVHRRLFVVFFHSVQINVIAIFPFEPQPLSYSLRGRGIPCHHGMGRRQVADVGDGHQICHVVATTSNVSQQDAQALSKCSYVIF